MPTLMDWAWVCTMALQAMLGNISDNFRRVTLEHGNSWELTVYLAIDDSRDREAAQEISDQLSVFLVDVRDRTTPAIHRTIKTNIIVASGELPSRLQDSRYRLIFARREDEDGEE